jgi:hypothetical protein
MDDINGTVAVAFAALPVIYRRYEDGRILTIAFRCMDRYPILQFIIKSLAIAVDIPGYGSIYFF